MEDGEVKPMGQSIKKTFKLAGDLVGENQKIYVISRKKSPSQCLGRKTKK